MEHQEQHKRRVRYKGTHPRKYNEKYKELQPDKYPETVERVIKKGSTPVGMHIPICVKEILEFLQIKPGQKGLDATLRWAMAATPRQCLNACRVKAIFMALM